MPDSEPKHGNIRNFFILALAVLAVITISFIFGGDGGDTEISTDFIINTINTTEAYFNITTNYAIPNMTMNLYANLTVNNGVNMNGQAACWNGTRISYCVGVVSVTGSCPCA